MTKDILLQTTNSHELFNLIKAHQELVDNEVMKHYDEMRLNEFTTKFPDADMHYDFFEKPLL